MESTQTDRSYEHAFNVRYGNSYCEHSTSVDCMHINSRGIVCAFLLSAPVANMNRPWLGWQRSRCRCIKELSQPSSPGQLASHKSCTSNYIQNDYSYLLISLISCWNGTINSYATSNKQTQTYIGFSISSPENFCNEFAAILKPKSIFASYSDIRNAATRTRKRFRFICE